MSTSIRTHQLHPLFVGEVSGVDVGRPLDTATITALWQAIDRYAVLVFRDQDLDEHQSVQRRRHLAQGDGEQKDRVVLGRCFRKHAVVGAPLQRGSGEETTLTRPQAGCREGQRWPIARAWPPRLQHVLQPGAPQRVL